MASRLHPIAITCGDAVVKPEYTSSVWAFFAEILEEVFGGIVAYKASRVFLLTEDGEWVEYAQSFNPDDEIVPPLPEFEDEAPDGGKPEGEDDHKHIW